MDNLATEYWDHVASHSIDPARNVMIYDNVFKRRVVLKRLLEFDFYKKSILEIGIGTGTIAGALISLFGDSLTYHATDLSPIFQKFCKRRYGIPVVNTDITKLPYHDASFDYVLAMDTLEHIPLEDRKQGNSEINRVMRKNSCIILLIPMDDSKHDPRFDHGFTMADLMLLIKTISAKLVKFELFEVIARKNGKIVSTHRYAFALAGRNLP